MSIELAEKLKKDLTDKYVVVSDSIPELKRFHDLTGHVKTVNMNCRALVQFDGPVDISIYDIAPEFLTVVDAPKPKAAKAAPAEAKKSPKPAAAKKSAGKSPLEMARAQGKGGKSSPPAGEKKLSPLEMARQQGSATGSKPAADKKEAPKAEAGKKLSPLEMARQQGASKGAKAESAEETSAPAEAPKKAESDDKNLSPLELARKQGAPKK